MLNNKKNKGRLAIYIIGTQARAHTHTHAHHMFMLIYNIFTIQPYDFIQYKTNPVAIV